MDLLDYCQNNGQRYLAEILGVSEGAISKWVSGKKNIPLRRAIKMVDLGIEPESLYQKMSDDDYLILTKVQK